jgi:predicted dehydrogenase
MKVLVIGAGSIGERHVRAFCRIGGVSVSVVEKQANRAMEIAARYGCVNYFTDLNSVPLADFDGAVVATPADSHVPIALLCAQAGLHLLLEKPLSTNLNGVADLIATCEQDQLTLAVAYVLRFHPAVAKLRELVSQGLLGRLLSAQVVCAHYLPTSRPTYLQTYYALKGAGGGVILDLSHELNYVEWLFGTLHLDASRQETVPDLDIGDEAMADLWLRSSIGVLAHIHLHAADRHVRRQCHVAGTDGAVSADLITGQVSVTFAEAPTVTYEHVSDRDQWHLDQAHDFLDAIRDGKLPRCTGHEGLQTLRLCIDAARGKKASTCA